LSGRRTYTRSSAGVTAAFVRSIRGGSGNKGVRHRWNIAWRLLGYPLLADRYVAFLDLLLLHDLDVSPSL
jgi:hypothetical protein